MSSAPQVLFIGGTGHIGTTVLEAILKKHPDLRIAVTIRSEEDAPAIRQLGLGVELVTSSLEVPDHLSRLAETVRLVINCGPDVPYPDAIRAILDSLAEQQQPCFYLGTSGAARTWTAPDGNSEGRIWDDIADFDALPIEATHGETDEIVLKANGSTLRTAIIAPPFVLGCSNSSKHPTPLIFPVIIGAIARLGCGFVIGEGKNMLTFIDVKDLAQLYVKFVDNALNAIQVEENKSQDAAASFRTRELWGREAYYFPPAALEAPFVDFMRDGLLAALQKHDAPFLTSTRVEQHSIEEITDFALGGREDLALHVWTSHVAEGCGVSTRTRGSRAAACLNMDRTYSSGMFELVDEAVKVYLAD